MGRHHVKLPEHLYLSPPSPQPPSALDAAASLLSLKAGTYTTPAALIQETSSTALAVGGKIPGFRTSAAFFTTLRANIYLDLEPPDSEINTPDCLHPTSMASSISSLPAKDVSSDNDADLAPRSALNLPKPTISGDAPEADPTQPSDPNEIPPLTSFPATTDNDRIEGLRLVADSVAQQRQRMARLLIFHPITIGILTVLFAVVYQYLPHKEWSDLTLILTTCSGIIMTMFVTVRSLGGGYIEEAERVGTWRWLDEGRKTSEEEETGKKVLGNTDEMILTKFGAEYIGAVVFRGVVSTSSSAVSSSKKQKKTNSTSSSTNQARTEIRAWTVRQKYRHKGVGTALLEDAIKAAKEKGWLQGGISIAEDHANSKRILPEMFNGGLTRNEERARSVLDKKVQEFESGLNEGKSKRRR